MEVLRGPCVARDPTHGLQLFELTLWLYASGFSTTFLCSVVAVVEVTDLVVVLTRFTHFYWDFTHLVAVCKTEIPHFTVAPGITGGGADGIALHIWDPTHSRMCLAGALPRSHSRPPNAREETWKMISPPRKTFF